jgi:hypothetical protein
MANSDALLLGCICGTMTLAIVSLIGTFERPPSWRSAVNLTLALWRNRFFPIVLAGNVVVASLAWIIVGLVAR